MNVLPKQHVSASDWAFHAWGQNAGYGLTIPADALQVLLDAYVEAATLRAAIEQRIKVTIDASGEIDRKRSLTMLRWGFWLLVCAVGCGSSDDSKDLFGAKVCVAGATQECVCPGSVKGAQACADDGSGWGACNCGGGSGSGGSAGNGSDGGGFSGSGAGGSCTPRMACPDAPDGGAQVCGMIDNYCGGTISCGCEFGDCSGGACACTRDAQYDDPCMKRYMRPIAMHCLTAATVPSECRSAQGPLNGVDGPGYPVNTFCCAH